jgi:hypothetical protein
MEANTKPFNRDPQIKVVIALGQTKYHGISKNMIGSFQRKEKIGSEKDFSRFLEYPMNLSAMFKIVFTPIFFLPSF